MIEIIETSVTLNIDSNRESWINFYKYYTYDLPIEYEGKYMENQ
jgi:hypothetical protein